MGGKKLTDRQKMEIALEMLAGRMSHSEICRKWGINEASVWKYRQKGLKMLCRKMELTNAEVKSLSKRVKDLRKLVKNHALATGYVMKKRKG